MLTAVSTAKRLDWGGWFVGIMGAIISGGAAGIGGAVGPSYVDPGHFNLTKGGFHHMMECTSICFIISAVISLAKFLQTHPTPQAENGN